MGWPGGGHALEALSGPPRGPLSVRGDVRGLGVRGGKPPRPPVARVSRRLGGLACIWYDEDGGGGVWGQSRLLSRVLCGRGWLLVLWKGSVWHTGGPIANGQAWRNVYAIQANDGPTALAALDQIALADQSVCNEDILINKLEVSTIPPGGGFYAESVNYAGARVTTGDTLPLWMCVRIDFMSGDGSRPERKYLRIGLTEDDIHGTIIDSGLITTIQNDYATVLVSNLDYVGPHGEPHTGSIVFVPVQMRQQNWHRHFRPGFHRAYVPNA